MTGKKLGYFKKFLKREDYNKVIEMGEEIIREMLEAGNVCDSIKNI